jgi:hypothetical protein
MTIPVARQFEFGPGICWLTPVTNYLGAAVVNPSPILFATMQDCSLDFSADLKELFGTYASPIAIGRGKQKYAIKLKNAQTHGRLWNAAFFGQTLTSGEIYDAWFDQTGSVVPATPFQVTVDPPGSGTILFPLGVRDNFDVPLTLVTGTPITRQYAYSAGVFTFAAADAGLTYYIDYRYTATGAGAPQTLVISNPVMGQAPTFQFDMKIPYNGMNFNASFPNCHCGKLGFATKLDDFSYPEFDFSAFAPGNAGVGTLSWSQ